MKQKIDNVNEDMLKNGKGVQFTDRELGAEVRSLTMLECKKHLKKGKGRLYEAILLRLAGSVLPRLSEVSGVDGSPISVNIVQYGNHAPV